MRVLLLVLLPVVLCYAAFPVEMEDNKPVEKKKKVLGTQYLQDGTPLKITSMFNVIGNYEECKSDISKAKANYYLGMVFSASGGILIGYPIGYGLGSGTDINWTIVLVGAGVATVGLVFSGFSGKALKRAVDKYNEVVGGASSEMKLLYNRQGQLSLNYNFKF
jgi:hypothetical protein